MEASLAITCAATLATKSDCQTFIENLALSAFQEIAARAKETISADGLEDLRQNAASIGSFLEKLQFAQLNIVDTPNENRALAFEGTQSITFYQDFFDQHYNNSGLRVNNEPRNYFSSRTPIELTQTVIHEGLHLMAKGFTDELLGSVLNGKALTGTDKERQKKGSELISKHVKEHCN
jgi:hypothetical protein